METGLIKHGVWTVAEVRAIERTNSLEAVMVEGNYVKFRCRQATTLRPAAAV